MLIITLNNAAIEQFNKTQKWEFLTAFSVGRRPRGRFSDTRVTLEKPFYSSCNKPTWMSIRRPDEQNFFEFFLSNFNSSHKISPIWRAFSPVREKHRTLYFQELFREIK